MDERLSFSRRDWLLLVLLLLLTFGMRVWQVKTSEVVARDSIGYVHYAWQLEHDNWRTVIPGTYHHPGYPLAVLAVSTVVRQVHSGPLPDVMETSAQIASSFASILLVIPMFFLGRTLFDRRVGFWATLLFQCLPASGRVLADGLSESQFLLFAAIALWLGVVAFNRRSPWRFAGVGLFGALAYLTRPEGGLIVAATGLVLVALQLRSTTRRSWGNFAASTFGLCAVALLLAAPFMILVRGVTTSNTGINVLPVLAAEHSTNDRPTAVDSRVPVMGVAQSPAVLAVWFGGRPGDTSQADDRRLWALTTLLDVLCKLFFYALWLPMLLALWIYRDRFRLFVGCWVLAFVSLALLPVLYRVAMKMGYLSDRHALLILCCGSYWTVAGLNWLGERCAALVARSHWVQPQLWACTLAALACVAGLVRTLEPMHNERTGFREAGYWLAEHAQPGDFIDDPYAWASYYAGRSFVDSPPYKSGTGHCVYVVIEWSSNKHPDLMPVSRMDYVFAHGELIKSWQVRRRKETAEIVLYKVAF